MKPEYELLREHLVTILRQLYPNDDVVIPVPLGIAILTTSGRHTLIRIDEATLEVAE